MTAQGLAGIIFPVTDPVRLGPHLSQQRTKTRTLRRGVLSDGQEEPRFFFEEIAQFRRKYELPS